MGLPTIQLPTDGIAIESNAFQRPMDGIVIESNTFQRPMHSEIIQIKAQPTAATNGIDGIELPTLASPWIRGGRLILC